MAENTAIEWATHSWSPWTGCTKVSPACDNCYAAAWANRTGHPELWAGERRRTSAAYWQKPRKWDIDAAISGEPPRIFPSLCDPFDNQVPSRWRDDFWHRIEQTPHVDWLLLTKRPQNIAKMLPDPRTGISEWGGGWPNVWLGMTAENQEEFDRRYPYLAAIPARVHFVSYEPALGPLSLKDAYPIPDWIICGGESGPGARPMHPVWPRHLRDQCAAAQVPFFFKQHGHWALVPIEEHLPGRPRMVREGDAMVAYDGQWEILGPSLSSSLEDKALPMRPVGKSRAGRLLDGREHNEFPA